MKILLRKITVVNSSSIAIRLSEHNKASSIVCKAQNEAIARGISFEQIYRHRFHIQEEVAFFTQILDSFIGLFFLAFASITNSALCCLYSDLSPFTPRRLNTFADEVMQIECFCLRLIYPKRNTYIYQ